MTYFNDLINNDFIKNPLNIFVIILLCLVLLATLGVYKEGFTSSETNNMNTNTNTNTNTNGITTNTKKIYIDGNELTIKTFTGTNGNTAEVVAVNGKSEIIITDINGKITKYNYNNNTNNNNTNTTGSYITQQTLFYGPFGGTARVTKGQNGNYLIELTNSKGATEYYIQNTSQQPQQQELYPGSSTYANVQSTNQPYTYPYSQQSQQNQQFDYSSSLPPGIPANQIPPGHEDLYILKSEVIPPVCPACPAPITSIKSKTEHCAPCPPCGRCPKADFECKKVPNYSSTNNDLPSAILPASYSTYGS